MRRQFSSVLALHPLCALAAGLVLTLGSPAIAAASTERAPDQYPTSDTLRIEVRGEIPPRCALTAPDGPVALGQVVDERTGGTLAGRAAIPLAVDCNSAFHYEVRSERGALVSTYEGPLSAPFRREIEYSMTLGSSGACRSAQMRDAPCIAQSARPALGAPTMLTVAWPADARPPVAGGYVDFVRIRVVPNMGER